MTLVHRPFLNSAPLPFWLGLTIVLACETLLWIDVHRTARGAVRNDDEISRILESHPHDALGRAARFVGVNMTALVWVGYLIFLEGLLTLQTGRSPIRQRPHHFATLALTSVFIWCVFDAINFNAGMGAWRYIGMPPNFSDRVLGYLLAFATIVPGMLMTGQALLNFGVFDWARSPSWRLPRWGIGLSLIVGIAMFLWSVTRRDPIASLTLWTSFVFLLDPLNLALGRPSMFRDWQAGWYGRTLAAFAGGFICGLLWEFWNYWALAKWTYRLPFLGSWEHVRYFEMPLIGMIGFLPFGIECWVMWQTIRTPLDGMVEALPDERFLL